MIIITGANGFVGQILAVKALKYFKRSEILCLVWGEGTELEDRGRAILKQNKIKTLEVDLVTKKGLNRLPSCPKLVIHLAANTDTSTTNHDVNDIGTRNLLDALGPLNTKTHIIYTSTTVLISGRKDCSKPFNENDRPEPSDEYGRSKLRAEKILRDRAEQEKFTNLYL